MIMTSSSARTLDGELNVDGMDGIERCGVRGLSAPEDALPDVLMEGPAPPPPRMVDTARCGRVWPGAAIFAGLLLVCFAVFQEAVAAMTSTAGEVGASCRGDATLDVGRRSADPVPFLLPLTTGVAPELILILQQDPCTDLVLKYFFNYMYLLEQHIFN